MAIEVGAKTGWMDDFHGGLIHYGYKKISTKAPWRECAV